MSRGQLKYGSWAPEGRVFATEDEVPPEALAARPEAKAKAVPKGKAMPRAKHMPKTKPRDAKKTKQKPNTPTTSMFDSRMYRRKPWPLFYFDGRLDYLYSVGCGLPDWPGTPQKGLSPAEAAELLA